MNIPSKRTRCLNEFCHNGNLENFRDLLSLIFDQIRLAGCCISARYEKDQSSHEFELDGCRMRICLNPIYEEPIHLIWTILHEFGHHLSGRPEKTNDFEFKKRREKLAWEIARQQALKYQVLANEIENFDFYSKICLKSYLDQIPIEYGGGKIQNN